MFRHFQSIRSFDQPHISLTREVPETPGESWCTALALHENQQAVLC